MNIEALETIRHVINEEYVRESAPAKKSPKRDT